MIKQDLRFVDTLDTVTLTDTTMAELQLSGKNASLVCKAVKSVFAVDDPEAATVIATFADGTP